jgi:hypothetical protein
MRAELILVVQILPAKIFVRTKILDFGSGKQILRTRKSW